MKFVVNCESEVSTKRTKALTWKEAHTLIIKELNESKNVLDFLESSAGMTNNELNELKPCPFCGHKAELHYSKTNETQFVPCFSVDGFGSLGYEKKTSKIQYVVSCNKCKCKVGNYTTRKSAIEAWNRRCKNDRA